MNKVWLTALATAWLAGFQVKAEALKPDDLQGTRPNMVFVITDDNSFDTVGRYGGGALSPHLDKLYDQSLRLNRFHVSPTCAPSRASLMTGRHEFYAGVTHTIYGRDRMNLELLTLPQMLRDNGYTTAMFGKWHLGDEKPYRPYQRGFDEVWQHGAGGIGQSWPNSADFPANTYHDPIVLHNETPIQTKGYCSDIFFDKAIEWIKQNKESGKPFFAYIVPNAPHSPHIPPLGYEDRFGSKATSYEKMQANIDDNVGKIIQFLDDNGLREDTLLVFYTDNGRSHQTVHGTKLKGGKGSSYEGGLWVPCLVSWPKHLPGNVDRGELCGHIDWFETLADLAGAKVAPPGTNPWDGRSLLPVLCGEADEGWDQRLIIGHRGRWENGARGQSQYKNVSIQNGKFKLYDHRELYDMREDLGETKNIAAHYPEVVAMLQKEYDQFWADATTYMINDAHPLPSQELKNEPFHQLYLKEFGPASYAERVEEMNDWKKGGQSEKEFLESLNDPQRKM
ncbi:arylsulfatase [Pontiella sulfatireligans]|uniref:Arylsulfatase n=1 Tax=Pontiella sulfatireligans TaxID=2750658 RepID=A0A6C2UKM8_9BACT|nr:arylsulfatase [Pontiella sulfatireligans]SPS74445.1 sulfatase S1_17 [Kiritimatiellales bacterium]VGO20792.1 Arylsulfatase [Pontiella sulfatireligans]